MRPVVGEAAVVNSRPKPGVGTSASSQTLVLRPSRPRPGAS